MGVGFNFKSRTLKTSLTTVLLSLFAAQPLLAAGTVSVTTPAMVTPSATQLMGPTIDPTKCVQQYSKYMNDLSISSTALDSAGLLAEGIGVGIELGLINF